MKYYNAHIGMTKIGIIIDCVDHFISVPGDLNYINQSATLANAMIYMRGFVPQNCFELVVFTDDLGHEIF